MNAIVTKLPEFHHDTILTGFSEILSFFRQFGTEGAQLKLGIFMGENQNILMNGLNRKGWHSGFYLEYYRQPSIENGQPIVAGVDFTQLNAATLAELDLSDKSLWSRVLRLPNELFVFPHE